jgi:hypothetical protein
MTEVVKVVETAAINPEAMVGAAVAATNAATSAYYASLLATVTLLAVLIMGAMVIYMAFKFREMVQHTDGMLASLIELTDKVSRAEGVLTGRQEQKDEDAAAKKQTKV